MPEPPSPERELNYVVQNLSECNADGSKVNATIVKLQEGQ